MSSGKLVPGVPGLGGLTGTGSGGPGVFSVSRFSPRLPSSFREALKQFRALLGEVLAALGGKQLRTWAELSDARTLGEAWRLAAYLEVLPDPVDCGKLLELLTAPHNGSAVPEAAPGLLPLAERVAELCPRSAVGLNAEAEAVRLELLEQLSGLERDAAAGKVWAFHAGGLRRHGPRFRELLSGLPSSACPHGDASRLAEVSRKLSNGGGFHAAWPLEDGAEKLAELTAPEPPHAPRVVPVPAFRCLLEPDPPLSWEGRAEVRGTWYGGGWWKGQGGNLTEAEPLAGKAWHVTGGPFREVPELLPVLFPLPLSRSDLPHWRGWVAAPE